MSNIKSYFESGKNKDIANYKKYNSFFFEAGSIFLNSKCVTAQDFNNVTHKKCTPNL